MTKPIMAIATARPHPKAVTGQPGSPRPTNGPVGGQVSNGPRTTLPSLEEVEAWLLSKHCAGWGEYFTIIEGKSSTTYAAEWFRRQIASFLEFKGVTVQ